MSEPTVSSNTETTNPLAMLDALLEPFNRTDSPGMVVAIAQHGQLLYRRAVGMASLEMGVANTPATRIRIASTSKQFTAMGILLLVEDGLIGLDDRLQKHLPEMPQLSDSGPTVRHLLTHTGGWRGHDELWALAHGLSFHPPGPGMPAMARQSALNFEPGTQMMYSNGGYHMLAKIIERVSGLSYNDFLTERLFAPLGMADTASVATDLEVVSRLAAPYLPRPGGGWTRGLYPCELEGGGSLVSTVDDMLRWLSHLRGDAAPVGRPESWAALHAPTTLASGSLVHYGFGLCKHPYRGVEIIHHAGAVLGATSQMLSAPAHGLDIIVLANGAPLNPSALAIKALETLLAEHLQPRAPRAQLQQFPAMAGQRYHARDTGSVLGFAEVEMAGQRMLGMSWEGSPPIPANQVDDRLWLGIQEISISDLALDAAALRGQAPPDVLTVTEGGQPRRFERIADGVPEAAQLAPQLCGSYFSHDLDASGTVRYQDGRLTLLVQGRHGQLESLINILSQDVATVVPTDPVLARLGQVVLSLDREAGRVVGLRLGSMRFRNLRFVRQECAA